MLGCAGIVVVNIAGFPAGGNTALFIAGFSGFSPSGFSRQALNLPSGICTLAALRRLYPLSRHGSGLQNFPSVRPTA